MNDPLQIAIFFGIITMIAWGIVDIFTKKAVDSVGQYVTFVYFQLGNMLMSVPLLLVESSIPDINAESVFAMMVFGTLDFVAFSCLLRALKIGKVSVVIPITSTWAVLAAIVSYFLFDELFPAYKILIFALIMIGIVFTGINFKDLRDGVDKRDMARGVSYAIIVFMIYGFYIPFWDKFIEQDGWVILSLLAKSVTMVIGFTYTVVIRKEGLHPKNKPTLIALILSGILQGIGVATYNLGLTESTETAIVNALSSAYPFPLAVAAYIFLKERLALNQYFGIAFIVAGIVTAALI